MDWKRIGRAALCLLVVVCLVINVCAVEAKAFVLESTAGTLGLVALLILATCGVVFNPSSVAQVEAIGNAFSSYMYQWGTEAEQLEAVESWIDNATIINGSDGEERPDFAMLTLPHAIMAGVIEWVISLIQGDSVEVPGEDLELTDGHALYNGIELPNIDSVWTNKEAYPYCFIYFTPNNNYFHVVYSSSPFYWDYRTVGAYTNPFILNDSSIFYYWLPAGSSSWQFRYESSSFQQHFKYPEYESNVPIWTNHDILQNNSFLYLGASEPITSSDVELYPESFIGDIPSGIQDGTLTEDDIVIPDINYGNLIQDGQTTEEAILDVLQQLKDGQMTYEDYMELTKTEQSTQPLPGTLAGTPVGDFLQGLVDALMTPFKWLADALLSGISALFVPSETFIQEKTVFSQNQLASRLGGVYQVCELFAQFFSIFTVQEANEFITVPSVTVYFGNVPFSFGGWNVKVIPDGFEFLAESCALLIDCVATLAFGSSMRKRFDEFLEG